MKETKPLLKLTLHNLGKIYESTGKTVKEAIANLKLPKLRGHGILVLEKGKKRKERILSARIVNGVFGVSSATTKNIAIKNIVTLFSEFE